MSEIMVTGGDAAVGEEKKEGLKGCLSGAERADAGSIAAGRANAGNIGAEKADAGSIAAGRTDLGKTGEGKPGRQRKRSKTKKRIVVIALLLVLLLLAAFVFRGFFIRADATAEYTEYTVQRGSVQVSVSGSGSVTPNKQYTVVAMVEGDVLSDSFEEGDSVEKDDVLYTIDSSEMEKTLEKADIAYERQQMSYQKSVDAYEGLTVKAPADGMVEELYVAKGDSVQNGAKIAKLVDNDTMTARIPFGEADAATLYEGQSVTVTVENTFEQLGGVITKIYNSKRILEGYISVTDVEISVENPGALQTGTYVTASVGGFQCYEPAALEASDEKLVTAKASGTVEEITVEGAYLSAGDQIARLADEEADQTLRSSQLSLRESQLSYESTQEQLDNYTITAPISGSVISKTVKAGDTLNDTGTQLAVIADMSIMTFEISVDELDISSMEVGQEVLITADALPEETFTGYVDNIALLGTSSQGVTSYPVTIVINEPEGLWPGMNVTGEIIVDSAEDVLLIPVGAVNRGNTVMVKEDGNSGSGGPTTGEDTDFGGSMLTKVTLGLNDDSYIQVTDGLSEGDIILVPQAAAESAASTEAAGQEGFMMMDGGGGMPSGGGGMPSGGGGGGMPSGGGMPGM